MKHCEECDSLGDTIYRIEGKIVKESDFKEFRRFSPKFRQFKIQEYIYENELSLTMMSSSCSKCGISSYSRTVREQAKYC